VSALAAIGHLSRDVVAGAPARPGGTVFYSARALARLGAHAVVGASCAAVDRAELVPPLEAFGLPVTWFESDTTTSYSFRYEGDRRIMRQECVGGPWTPERARDAVTDAAWVHVGALVRTDFPEETLAALAESGRRLLVDAQGLVRTADLGPLRTDRAIGGALRHVAVLKVNDEEAAALVGDGDHPERLRTLGVDEVILTLASEGSFVVTPAYIERVPPVRVTGPVDPTGAGDTFSAVYLMKRASGAEPVEAARAATEVVAEFLTER
jgi:sugar/nucleoside kinase (ribokinase family)